MSFKNSLKAQIIYNYSNLKDLSEKPYLAERTLRKNLVLYLKFQDYINDNPEKSIYDCIELFYEFVDEKEYLKSQQANYQLLYEKELLIRGATLAFTSIFMNDILYYGEDEQIKILKQIWDYLKNKITDFRKFHYNHRLIEALFTRVSRGDDEDEEDDDEDISSLSGEDIQEINGQNFKIKYKLQQVNAPNGKEGDKPDENEEHDDEIENIFLTQPKAFLSENVDQEIKDKLVNKDLLQVTDFKEQIEILLLIQCLTEIVVSKLDDEEPSFKAMLSNFEGLSKQLKNAQDIIMNSQIVMNKNQRDFILQFIEEITYFFLDVAVEATQNLQIDENISKVAGEAFLRNQIQFIEYVNTQEESNHQVFEQFINTKCLFLSNLMLTISTGFNLVMACTKSIGYYSGYIGQDKTVEYEKIINKGMKILLTMTTKILNQHGQPIDLNPLERNLIFSLFDSLSYGLNFCNYLCYKDIINDELLENLLILCSLDKKEEEDFLVSHLNNKFFQNQAGSNSKHYKEFAYSFISNLIVLEQCRLLFLGKCVKTYKENKESNPKKAASALFALAICNKEDVEEIKAHVITFLNTEVVPLLKNPQNDTLLLFRAIWIIETYCSLLEKEQAQDIMQYITEKILADDSPYHEIIKVNAVIAIYSYLNGVGLDEENEEEHNFEDDAIKFNKALTEDLKLTPYKISHLYLDYAQKYRELFEFLSGLEVIMTFYQTEIDYDIALIRKLCLTIPDCYNTIIAKDQFIDEIIADEDTTMDEYYKPMQVTILRALGIYAHSQNENEKTEIKKLIKEMFKKVLCSTFYCPGKRTDQLMLTFVAFFKQTDMKFDAGQNLEQSDEDDDQHEEEEKKESESILSNSYDLVSDKQILQSILYNTLYYFNAPQKIEWYLEECKKKKLEGPHDSNLLGVDGLSLPLQFIFDQIGSNISLIINAEYSSNDPDEELSKINTNLYNYVKVYTKQQQLTEKGKLTVHISYWLLISTMIENGLIEELDADYIEKQQEDNPYFLFEESIDLLMDNLLKLANWYNQTIYLFFFQILNLYYFYDVDRTYHGILKAFANKPENQSIFTKDYKMIDSTSLEEEALQEIQTFLHSKKGNIWIVMGISSLLEESSTKNQAKQFIRSNVKELMESIKHVRAKIMGDEPPINQDQKQIEIQLLDGLVKFEDGELVQTGPLDPALQICFTHFQSQIDVSDLKEKLISILQEMLEQISQSIELSVDDKQLYRQKILDIQQELEDENQNKDDEDD